MKNPSDLYLSVSSYYPFGMPMLNRQYGANYRFGFNGKEQDNEVEGKGDILDYGSRIYDPRLGRFLSVDPHSKKYSWNSPYDYGENRVIDGIDFQGKGWTDFCNSIKQSYNGAAKFAKETYNSISDKISNSIPSIKIEGKVTYGIQVGLELKKGIGLDINVINAEAVGFSYEVQNVSKPNGPFKVKTKLEGDYISKDGVVKTNSGVAASVPGASLSVNHKDITKTKGLNEVENTIEGGIGTPIINAGGSVTLNRENEVSKVDYGTKGGFKLAALIGIEISWSVGKTSEKIKQEEVKK